MGFKEKIITRDAIADAALTTISTLQKRGWRVDVQLAKPGNNVVETTGVVGCMDDRHTNTLDIVNPRQNKQDIALPGGTYFIATTENAQKGIIPLEKAGDNIRKTGAEPFVHGDTHQGVPKGCAAFNHFHEQEEKGGPRLGVPIRRTTEETTKAIEGLGIDVYTLRTKHKPEELTVSFVPGMTPIAKGTNLRLTGDYPLRHGVPPQVTANTTAKIIEKISPVRKATVIIPNKLR